MSSPFQATNEQPSTPWDQVLDREIVAAFQGGRLELPAYPGVGTRLNAVLQSPTASMSDVTAVVRTDQSLVADVLRVASSPSFAGSPIASLDRALGVIGFDEARRLLLARTLGAFATASGALAALRHQVWRESVISAIVARQLGLRRRVDGEAAFLCGLLHDFGRLVVLVGIERMLATRPSREVRGAADWMAIVERHHVRAGIAVAEKWNLPEVVTGVIEHHHQLEKCPPRFVDQVRLTIVTDRLNRIVHDVSHVTVMDLDEIPALTPTERDFLARLLPRACESVAAFAQGNRGLVAPSAVTRGPSRLVGRLVPVNLPVAQLLSTGRVPFRAEAVGADTMVMTGASPIVESSLVKLDVTWGKRTIELWANVLSCVPEKGRYRLEVKGFAMSPEIKRTWSEIYGGQAPAGPAKS